MHYCRQPSMKKVLIVGQGIAGTCMGFELMNRDIHVEWIDQPSLSCASRIASGLYNPVVLKRMRMVHMADAFNKRIEPFYSALETFVQNSFFYPKPIYRIFHDVEEQNNWNQLSDNPKWSTILGDIITDEHVKAPYGLGTVKQTGWVDTAKMLKTFREKMQHQIIENTFDSQRLKHLGNTLEYDNKRYDAIVFAEGWRAAENNPYYPRDAFRPSKGELLTVKLDQRATPNRILHFKHFLIPLGEKGTFKTGATYVHGDFTDAPTNKSKEDMLSALYTVCPSEATVVKHDVGIRAATKDRKPMIGKHPNHNNIYFLNGLGSRSILMAPYLSQALAEHMLHNRRIDPSIDVNRFF